MSQVFKIVLALACLVAACLSTPLYPAFPGLKSKQECRDESQLGSRIIDGQDAPVGAFPYMASLRRETTKSHFCGGSIISERHILTAAHCLDGQEASNIYAVVGSNLLSKGGKIHKAKSIVINPKYDRFEINHDVGLITLENSIEFDDFAAPLKLAFEDINENNYPAISSGWGRNDTSKPKQLPDKLQYFTTCLVDEQTCDFIIGHSNGYQKVCTFTHYGQGVCNGDSGSPLVADGVQIGIASYVINDCADGYPDVFTKVYTYLDWIKEEQEKNL